MLVVSDTSPIRALAHIEQMGLLPVLFGQVLIPPAVLAELMSAESVLPPMPPKELAMLRVQAPLDRGCVARFRTTLHGGESEALALALEVHADAILIDEEDGRDAAKRVGIQPIGALGVLLRGKREGLITAVRPLVDRLQTEMDFFVSRAVRDYILREAGE